VPQFETPHKATRQQLMDGLLLLSLGLFMKVVCADTLLSGAADTVFGTGGGMGPLDAWTGVFAFSGQIFFDFAGYSTSAIGVAMCLGFILPQNFFYPYAAIGFSDFWRRWHISLSSWCNDFIYNPFIVKFRRFGNIAVVTGIFLTFFIVGIWHGANWTFVILGVLQGIAIVYEFYSKRNRLKIAAKFPKSVVNTLSRIIVFLFMNFSMVFFYSSSVSDAWYFISHLFSNIQFSSNEFSFISHKPEFVFALFCFAVILIMEMYIEKGKDLMSIYLKKPLWIQWIGYLTCMALIYIFRSEIGSFYYMRF